MPAPDLDNNDTMNAFDRAPEETELLEDAESSRARRSHGNLLLVSVLLAGLGCVYLLSRWHGQASATASDDTQRNVEIHVDTALERLSRTSTDKSNQRSEVAVLMKNFYAKAKLHQVASDRLHGNPFVFKSPPVAPLPMAETDPADLAPSVRDESEKQLSQALEAARGLHLQSILMGAGDTGATAMISNNLLSEGQQICGWTITSIYSNKVTLTWKDQTHTLKMSH